jgi:SAM-dependent methyltransferase
MSKQMWDERYGADEFAYGKDPNALVLAEASRIPPGRVLCLAEGEGRNAVFLASQGYAVTAVDYSPAGLAKARRLADERGVQIELVEADLATYDLGTDMWSGIISIFAHTSVEIRRRVHAAIPRALRVGGVLILEAYRPEQLAHGTGGPRDAALMPTLADLVDELRGLDLVVAHDASRDVHEGRYHHGPSATVQLVAIRRR